MTRLSLSVILAIGSIVALTFLRLLRYWLAQSRASAFFPVDHHTSWDYGAKYLLGFPLSFGVFQEYYSTHAPFSKESSGIAIIGSSAMVWHSLKRILLTMALLLC